MNPPSAIQGAMGRERKPFTYTPGGLDLSEIKSERMAKRLMRNAMNQGVPELPPPVQSPSTPTTPIAVPNYNALPVQVFPTFNLPANPKSLLKTRSVPDRSRDPPTPKIPPPSTQNTNSFKPSGMDQLREALNSNTPAYMPLNNNNFDNNRPAPTYDHNNGRPTSMYEFNAVPNVTPNLAKTTYGSDAYTSPVLPEISYDAEFFQVAPKPSFYSENMKVDTPINNTLSASLQERQNEGIVKTDFAIRPYYTDNASTATLENETIVMEDNVETDNDDQTVKVVKKQVKKAEKKVESEVKHQNGDQNGESEAEMTVKLPTKKSAAKTETNVEVVKKTLPDGSTEEIKTTITKTTIDGKTNITTKTETKIIPKAEEEADEVEEEEVEEEEAEEVVVEEVEENGEKEEESTNVVVRKTVTQEAPVVTGSVVKKEETSETTTTKKVVVIQNEPETEEEVVEEEEEEPETTSFVIKKTEEKVEKQEQVKEQVQKVETKQEEVEEEEEEEEEVEEEEVKVQSPVTKAEPPKKEEPEPEEEDVEEEEEYEEAEEPEDKPEPKPEPKVEPKLEKPVVPEKEIKEDEEESEYTEEEIESEKEEPSKEPAAPVDAPSAVPTTATVQAPIQASEAPEVAPEKVESKLEGKEEETKIQQTSVPVSQPASEPSLPLVSPPKSKVPLREPSIPLEKVEDVEIKPIGAVSETISKSHSERTEIISSLPERPSGTLSTQTEYNKIENIVTVNKTTKTLDHSYEQLTQQGLPTVKTYFAPGRERVSPTPQPARPYQPYYTPPPPQQQPQIERRHSLLLERLSTERQMPSDIYQKQTSYQQQFNNQNYEQQRQWSQEPQSEVVNDSNVKPSTITKNQQWYQQSRKENVLYNNVTPSTPAVPSQQWNPPPPQPQPQLQPQPQSQHQPHANYQQPYEIYTDNSLHDSSKLLSSAYQQTSYPGYTPVPNNWASNNVGSALPNVNTQSNQYSYSNKTSSESYQNTNQQYSSSYVPPPWEQDPNYVAPQFTTQNYYKPEPPSTNTFSPTVQSGWKPTPPAAKFSKPVSKSYIPPAPNQSFVKSAVPEPMRRPGSKTYYSEYERRYITVPESTYIPSDAKFQAQPDPSPQYYYDNNEPSEAVEHEWRKELREFTEKSQTTQTQQTTQNQQMSQTQQMSHQMTHQVTEQTSVNPPWEEDSKYTKVPTVTYTPTPSWSQTLRPQSNRERSFESEYVGSNEWSKTNTLGRSRPLSTYQNSNIEPTTPERQRGVSVDRYNPNKYQSPMTIPYDSEHGPVQAHTLDPTPSPHRGYHNPNVPAYHANRASAEPREHQQTTGQARNWGLDTRATPIQSRSFKYLQWITGTED